MLRVFGRRGVGSFESRLGSLTGGSVNFQVDSDGLARVTLDHQAKHNALSGSMMLELRRVVESLESACSSTTTSPKAVVFTGAGERAFCAGSDLDCLVEFGSPEEGVL